MNMNKRNVSEMLKRQWFDIKLASVHLPQISWFVLRRIYKLPMTNGS
jgi:hypothetical protein